VVGIPNAPKKKSGGVKFRLKERNNKNMDIHIRLNIGLIILLFGCSVLLLGASPNGCSRRADTVVGNSSQGTIIYTPYGLTAAVISSTQISLTWIDNSDNEDGFKIERKTGIGGVWIQIATVGAGTASYSDTDVVLPNAYYYRIRAYNGSGDSGYSTAATATTPASNPPSAPSALTATLVSITQINLYWTNVANETGYKIERGFTPNDYTQIATTATDVVTYNDTTVEPGNVYYYRVRSSNEGGNSDYSPEVLIANPIP
jgi:hypothetical protein